MDIKSALLVAVVVAVVSPPIADTWQRMTAKYGPLIYTTGGLFMALGGIAYLTPNNGVDIQFDPSPS